MYRLSTADILLHKYAQDMLALNLGAPYFEIAKLVTMVIQITIWLMYWYSDYNLYTFPLFMCPVPW